MADPDELVRMRVGDALEKVCREQPGWFVAHIDRLLSDLGQIAQPSVQWHVAQMLQHLRIDLSDDQAQQATELLHEGQAQGHRVAVQASAGLDVRRPAAWMMI